MLYFLVVFLVITACSSLPYKDCGSDGANVLSFKVTNCTKLPCTLINGRNFTIQVYYISGTYVTKPKNSLTGTWSGNTPGKHVVNHFPVPKDCCTNGNLECPVGSRTYGTYNLTYSLPESFPEVNDK